MDSSRQLNCPVCKTPELLRTELEPNLSSYSCFECEGHWIHGKEYWDWLELHASNRPERLHEQETLSLAEPGVPLDCPECRFRMVKYLVGRGLDFSVDHCAGCKGIWLDRNEWEALKKATCTTTCTPFSLRSGSRVRSANSGRSACSKSMSTGSAKQITRRSAGSAIGWTLRTIV